MITPSFWKDKKVLITGNTGFKGSWLSLWLSTMGAEVYGYALTPPTTPSFYDLCGLGRLVKTNINNVRNWEALSSFISAVRPEIVFHMAAQPLVLDSYRMPAETFETNVMGTVNLLESVRKYGEARAIIVVTSDKCYLNMERRRPYREGDPLGGFDPYSASKACEEIVSGSYLKSFFSPDTYSSHGVALATVRAGNVIGGGDWANNRLLPDCIRALLRKETIAVRNPDSIRPWQHVFEPLAGYLMLAEKLYRDGAQYSGAWNFGPDPEDMRKVEWLVKRLCELWPEGKYELLGEKGAHEAKTLLLDSTKARTQLEWRPRWKLEHSLDKIIEWTRVFQDAGNIYQASIRQLEEYTA